VVTTTVHYYYLKTIPTGHIKIWEVMSRVYSLWSVCRGEYSMCVCSVKWMDYFGIKQKKDKKGHLTCIWLQDHLRALINMCVRVCICV